MLVPVKEEGYVTITSTLCQGNIFAWKDDNNMPVFYPSWFDAMKEIAEDMMIQLDEFTKEERAYELVDAFGDGPTDQVAYAKIYENGAVTVFEVIRAEDGEPNVMFDNVLFMTNVAQLQEG